MELTTCIGRERNMACTLKALSTTSVKHAKLMINFNWHYISWDHVRYMAPSA